MMQTLWHNSARLVFVLIVLSALAVSVAWCDLFGSEETLSLRWDALEHDFGVTSAGTTLQCAFVVHNTSPHRTTISGVRPSCGCVAHRLSDRTIPPGKSCGIAIKVSTKGLTPPLILNKFIDVTLQQNGILQTQRLNISAQLRPAVLIDQSPMVLTTNGPDFTARGRLTVQRGTLSPDSFRAITPRVPTCYDYSILQHTAETFVLDVTGPVENFPAQLPPLTLSYPPGASNNATDVPIRLAADPNVLVIPPSVVIVTSPSSSDDDSPRSETKVARLESPSGQSLRVTDVHVVSNDQPQLFTWSILSGSPDSLAITLESPPTDTAVHACRFDITYERSGTGSQGRAVLRAYAVTTKTLPASPP